MKRFLSGVVISSMLLSSVAPCAFGAGLSTESRQMIDNVKVYYNASLVNMAQPAALENGRVSLALRDFFEGINVPVTWVSETRSATVTTADKILVIFPDTGRITMNGQEMKLDAPPQMVGYHIYVPLRFLSEQLGYEVEYAQENGTHVVRIKGGAQELVKLHDGEVSRIKDRTLAVVEPERAQESANFTKWRANNVRYFVDTDGMLNRVVSQSDAIEVDHIDPAKAAVTTARYSTPERLTYFGKITAAGRKGYDLVVNPRMDTRYVGVGVPTDVSPVATLDTDIGRLLLYHGKAVDTVLNIDSTSGVVNGVFDDPSYGYVLDTIELSIPVEDASFAVASNGFYGFLLDGFFMIVDPQKYEVVFSELVSGDLEDGQVVAMGNDFVISGVENSRFASRMGYYTAVFAADNGNQMQFYTNMLSKMPSYNRPDVAEFGYIEPRDQFVEGNKIVTLFKTQWDCYLGIYDKSDASFVMRELAYPYESFIPTPDGYALFMKDSAYFYIQPVEGI